MSTESRRFVEPEREIASPSRIASPKEERSRRYSSDHSRHSGHGDRSHSSRSNHGSHSDHSRSHSSGDSRQQEANPNNDYIKLRRNGDLGEAKALNATDLFKELLRALRRLYLLPIILSVLFSIGFCY